MPRRKHIDPEDVAENVAESVLGSRTRSRRVLCDGLFQKFGFKKRTDERSSYLVSLLRNHGILVSPDPMEVKTNDWLHLTLAVDPPPPSQVDSLPPPSAEWFSDFKNRTFTSEREVEYHFAATLFHELGYTYDHEAIGYRLDYYEGVTLSHPEVDLLYFETADHSLETGNPLVLVECKTPSHDRFGGLGQAKNYAAHVRPLYYIVTNGENLVAYRYQGTPARDLRILDVKRSDIDERWDEIYRLLSHDDVVAAKSHFAKAMEEALRSTQIR
jgi:hypothetical protein